MQCEKCNAEIEGENTFCTDCGAKVEKKKETKQATAKKSKNKLIIGIVAALIVIAVAAFFFMSKGTEVICNKPYIQVGNDCCLDENVNRLCDNTENLNKNDVNAPVQTSNNEQQEQITISAKLLEKSTNEHSKPLEVTPGKPFNVVLELENDGTTDTTDIEVELSGLYPPDFGKLNSDFKKQVDYISKGETKTIYFQNLKYQRDLIGNQQFPLLIKINYNYGSNKMTIEHNTNILVKAGSYTGTRPILESCGDTICQREKYETPDTCPKDCKEQPPCDYDSHDYVTCLDSKTFFGCSLINGKFIGSSGDCGNMNCVEGKGCVAPPPECEQFQVKCVTAMRYNDCVFEMGAWVWKEQTLENTDAYYCDTNTDKLTKKTEIETGCTLDVKLKVSEIGGTPQICYGGGGTAGQINFTLDNQGKKDVKDLGIVVGGASGVYQLANLNISPIIAGGALFGNVTYDYTAYGNIRYVMFIPKVDIGGVTTSCPGSALQIDSNQLRNCTAS